VNTAALTDLGSAALDKASELTSTAAELVPDLPDQVGRFARRARRRFQPAKTRSPWRPALMIVVAIGACLVLVAWWRRSSGTSNDRGSVMPESEQTERAAIAAVS
jgi:ferric-dicitrate binding protein FerR (iron transport regulator)